MDFSAVGESPFCVRLSSMFVLESWRMDTLAYLVASFFYVGKSPKAPGTMGSLAALPLAWFVWQLPYSAAWGFTVTLFLVGVWASHRVVKKSGKEDHQEIVLDEVVGILVATSVAAQLWWHYVLAFLFFRVIDIFKPGPIGWLDRKVKGGFGAMVDDLAAAIFAALLLWIVLQASGPMLGGVVA